MAPDLIKWIGVAVSVVIGVAQGRELWRAAAVGEIRMIPLLDGTFPRRTSQPRWFWISVAFAASLFVFCVGLATDLLGFDLRFWLVR